MLEGVQSVLGAALGHAVERRGVHEFIVQDRVTSLWDGPPERDVRVLPGVAEEGSGGAEEVPHSGLEGDVGGGVSVQHPRTTTTQDQVGL